MARFRFMRALLGMGLVRIDLCSSDHNSDYRDDCSNGHQHVELVSVGVGLASVHVGWIRAMSVWFWLMPVWF